MNPLRHMLTLGLITGLAATLSACGGAGSSATAPGATVKGVAATGSAISKGSVVLNCTAGSTAAVSTASDGSYQIDISNMSLPCVARVDFTDSAGKPAQLHSLVRSAGTVNINPVTDMVVASLSATGAASDVQAAEIKTFTEDRIRTATQLVKTELTSKGVSTAFLPDDVIGTQMTAASGSVKGDDYDSVLDGIAAKTNLKAIENELETGHETGSLSTSTGQPGDAAAGKALYEASCQSCHGPRIADATNASKILKAIQENEGGMGFLASTITATAADSIATYMASAMTSNKGTGTTTTLTTQRITFTPPAGQTLGATAPALSASASSGLPVTITSLTPAVCSVSTGILKMVTAGNCTLTASQPGNGNFAAAPSKTITFTITDPNAPVVTPTGVIPVASNGKTLYASRCSGCHGPAAAGGSKVLNGANSPLTIQAAINSNRGGMGSLSGLTTQNLADIAAYLATPNI
ncbi:MAG: c-type cytochrome [Comamonadaceae bacterium]